MKERGQAALGYVVTIGLASIAGLASYFGAINAQSASVASVDTKVEVLKKSDEVQNENIKDMKGDIEYIRRVIEEQARRQGIIVKDDKVIYDTYER